MSSEENTTTPDEGRSSTPAILSPIPPPQPATPSKIEFTPLVTVVDFHHARGPEVETWFGVEEGSDPAADFGWSLLPFMALSDGAHASEEDFSYFTLLRPQTGGEPATSLFGISCTRQLDASQLLNRPPDVTRSTVQKAVVVIADSPQFFGLLRERLGIVTHAWFSQRDFTDVEILRRFQESLADEKARGVLKEEAERDQHLGMSLRELVHEFKWQTLVLLKCCLLQPKMLFFGSRCDRLCMVQFSLISLIPGLIRNLQDCADPELNSYEATLSKPTSLQSSNRASLLSYMGLPLQIFGKGGLFGPYTPLQQLDILADFGTKSYIVGSTNSLLLQQRDRYSDILINLDDNTVNITSTSLRQALGLTAADRRWIDFLAQEVNDTWDEANPSRPKTLGYRGSEEFIRSQFEAYILGLVSSVKFHNFLVSVGDKTKGGNSAAEADPAVDFGLDWVEAWMRTENYRMWNAHTDENIFAVSEPKHPCAGGLTIEDIQRHISEQVKELHLDERLAQGRDILGRNLAAGREKASSVFNKLYSDVEYMRESQRRRAEDARTQDASKTQTEGDVAEPTKAQPAVQSVGARAGTFMSGWASWAGEKRKTGGWGSGWGKKAATKPEKVESSTAPASPTEKSHQFVSVPGPRATASEDNGTTRPTTQESFGESILSGAPSSSERPTTASSTGDATIPDSAAARAPVDSDTSDLKKTESVKDAETTVVAKDEVKDTNEPGNATNEGEKLPQTRPAAEPEQR